MVVAGEASGDLHGARMVQRLKRLNPSLRISGMGGDKLRAAGVSLLFDCKSISVIGLFEVLSHWPEIKRALRTIEHAIVQDPPQLLVLIDYVEFNLRIAAVARRAGIKVLFYISPKIWAWRPERIKKIRALVDMMAVIFPFEVDYYARAGVPVRYVGHPLNGNVECHCTRRQLDRELGITADQKIVGLLPGSRVDEIRYILPVLLESARFINRMRNDIVYLLPLAPGLPKSVVEKYLRTGDGLNNVLLLDGRAYDVMHCADAIAIASGTATLEAAILATPMAIVYRVSALSWLWIKRKLQIKHVGLVNIVAGREVVREFIQRDCRAELIADELIRLLDNADYRDTMRSDLGAIRSLLGDLDAAEEVAKLALELLPNSIMASTTARPTTGSSETD